MLDRQVLQSPAELSAMADQLHADNVSRFLSLVGAADAWLASRPAEARDDVWGREPEIAHALEVLRRWLHVSSSAYA